MPPVGDVRELLAEAGLGRDARALFVEPHPEGVHQRRRFRPADRLVQNPGAFADDQLSSESTVKCVGIRIVALLPKGEHRRMATNRILKTIMVIVIACVILAAIWCSTIFDPAFRFLADRWREIATAINVVAASLLVACIWSATKGVISSPACCTCETDDYCKEKYKCLPDPYPCEYKNNPSITGFKYQSHLHLLRLKQRPRRIDTDREAQYIVDKNYTVCYQLNNLTWHAITVPRGTLTDLASVPRMFRGIVGRVGPHLEASIVHDYLYVAWQVKGKCPTDSMRLRRFADKLYLKAMREAGMGCKAHLIYLAVRVAGGGIFCRRNPKPWILCDEKLPPCCANAEDGQSDEKSSPENDA